MKTQSDPVWKFVVCLLLGVAVTFAYVRFGYELPGVVQLGKNVTAKAVSATAEADLYNPRAPMENRQRALAIIVGHNPDLFIEVDTAIGNQFFAEVLRRKAVRQSKLIKERDRGYAMALAKPNLRLHLEKKHGVTDTARLKRKMLISDIRDEEFLHGYLTRRFPNLNDEELAELVLGVYQNGLQRVEDLAADESRDSVIR